MIFFQADIGSHIGTGATTAAITYGLVKVIDHLARRKESKETIPPCKAKDILERIEEYHQDNKKVLTDIRDGVNKIVDRADRADRAEQRTYQGVERRRSDRSDRGDRS